MKVILSCPLVLRSRGYYVGNLGAWDRFGSSAGARVRWLEAVLGETPDFDEARLGDIQLGGLGGWLRVVCEEEQ